MKHRIFTPMNKAEKLIDSCIVLSNKKERRQEKLQESKKAILDMEAYREKDDDRVMLNICHSLGGMTGIATGYASASWAHDYITESASVTFSNMDAYPAAMIDSYQIMELFTEAAGPVSAFGVVGLVGYVAGTLATAAVLPVAVRCCEIAENAVIHACKAVVAPVQDKINNYRSNKKKEKLVKLATSKPELFDRVVAIDKKYTANPSMPHLKDMIGEDLSEALSQRKRTALAL